MVREMSSKRTRRAGSVLRVARPSWISGAARLVDLGGIYTRYALQRVPQPPSNGLSGDWEVVGSDLKNAWNVYSSQQQR